jgi:hypothetical protein
MAFLLKNQSSATAARRNTDGTAPILTQYIKTSRATDSLPATATETIFEVEGGRILLFALVGEVTTAIQNQACTLAIAVDSDAGAAVDLASAVSVANLGVGTYITPEGDGTAGLAAGIGWGQACLTPVIVGPGAITITTSATNTGSVKWDLYYMPLDEASYVTASAI